MSERIWLFELYVPVLCHKNKVFDLLKIVDLFITNITGHIASLPD